MGAYLSTPVTEKESCDSATETLKYGASSMQGWRVSQEDSHNCCPDFDLETGTALFAVYDGHGGAEVAQYTSMHLPEFIKQLPAYKESRLAEALEKSFLEFDVLLTKEEVIKELRDIAGVNIDEDEKEKGEGSDNETEALYEEATMPLEKLLERYGGPGMKKNLADLRKKHNILSPIIRKKGEEKEGDDEISKPESDDVKVKLDEQLMNGHDDNNSEAVEEKTVAANKNDSEPSSTKEASSIGEASNEQNVTDVSPDGNDPVSSTTKTIGDVKKNIVPANQDSGVESEVSSSDIGSNDLCNTEKRENACNNSNSAELAGKEASSSSKAEESITVGGSSNMATPANAEVSSSAVGSSSTGAESSAKESSSTNEEPSSNAVGSSTSSVGPSSAGGSSQNTDNSTMGSEPEAGSSLGRTRKARKNVIPEEGEDESSFDEDDEDDEDADVDEEDWGSGSSSDDEDEEDGDEAEHGSDEDDEQMEVMCGGEEPGADSGCTAVVALLRGRELYVANAGDSRCVLSRESKAVDMSVDHKPEDDLERKRIVKAGGRVTFDGRVNGGLNLSRALGDHCYKKNSKLSDQEQMITALPDIRCMTLDEKDEFMVLACDGIWNVMTSQDVVNFVAAGLASGTNQLSTICEQLFDFCIAPDTTGDGTGCDNMTCVIVTFEKLGKCAVGTAKRRSSTEADSTDATDPKKQKSEQD